MVHVSAAGDADGGADDGGGGGDHADAYSVLVSAMMPCSTAAWSYAVL